MRATEQDHDDGGIAADAEAVAASQSTAIADAAAAAAAATRLAGDLAGFGVLGLDGYRDWPRPIEDTMRRLVEGDAPGPGVQPRQALLLLRLVATVSDRVRAARLPEAFDDEYRRYGARVVRRMREGRGWAGGIENDVFRKDLAVLALRMLPCVSHLVGRSGLPRRTLLRPANLAGGASARALWALRGRLHPLLENHVHPEMLEHFDEDGRRACYRLVAALLRWQPELQGLMGTSWYYDRAVGRISPRLAYLRDGPAAWGACFLDAGQDRSATAGATATSAHRRQLAEAGRYRPRNITMLWSRARLLGSPLAA